MSRLVPCQLGTCVGLGANLPRIPGWGGMNGASFRSRAIPLAALKGVQAQKVTLGP